MKILFTIYFWIYYTGLNINKTLGIPKRLSSSYTGAGLLTGLSVFIPIFVLLDYFLPIKLSKLPIYFCILIIIIIFEKILKKVSINKSGVEVKEKIEDLIN